MLQEIRIGEMAQGRCCWKMETPPLITKGWQCLEKRKVSREKKCPSEIEAPPLLVTQVWQCLEKRSVAGN